MTGAGFAQALVWGFLANPASTREEINQVAARVGMAVTTPGLDQRFTAQAVPFLDSLLQHALSALVETTPGTASLLSRFSGVFIADTTSIALPSALASVWHGPNGIDDAAVKVAVRWDLQQGGLHLWLSGARVHDQRTGVCAGGLPPGSLRLNDLGFFQLDTFAADLAQGVDFFSRYKLGTTVFSGDGQKLDLAAVLRRRGPHTLDVPILLGQQRLPCRLLALPVSAAVAAERRRRLRSKAQRKQRPVSPLALRLAGWTLYVTSLSPERLKAEEAPWLYATRWQIERLFKLWKGSGLLDEWRSHDPYRIWCEFYAKLLALLVQHWLTVIGCWQHLDRSLHRAAQLIRKHALHLAVHLPDRLALIQALSGLAAALTHACRLHPRATRPHTFQAWLEVLNA